MLISCKKRSVDGCAEHTLPALSQKTVQDILWRAKENCKDFAAPTGRADEQPGPLLPFVLPAAFYFGVISGLGSGQNTVSQL